MLHFYFHDIISIDCICNSFNVSIATIVLHCSPLFVVALLLSIMPRYHQLPFSSHSEDTRLSDFLRCFALQFIGARDWRPKLKTLFDDLIMKMEEAKLIIHNLPVRLLPGLTHWSLRSDKDFFYALIYNNNLDPTFIDPVMPSLGTVVAIQGG